MDSGCHNVSQPMDFRSVKRLNIRELSDMDYNRYGGTHSHLSNQEVEAGG